MPDFDAFDFPYQTKTIFRRIKEIFSRTEEVFVYEPLEYVFENIMKFPVGIETKWLSEQQQQPNVMALSRSQSHLGCKQACGYTTNNMDGLSTR